MILKYKLENGSWRYITLTDFVIGKVDITEVYNKYLDKETGKIKFNYCEDERYQITNLFSCIAYYSINTLDIYNILHENDTVNKHMNYIIISYNKDNTLILYDEAYIMSDSGKTIEKLI